MHNVCIAVAILCCEDVSLIRMEQTPLLMKATCCEMCGVLLPAVAASPTADLGCLKTGQVAIDLRTQPY